MQMQPLQTLIHHAASAEEMVTIARAYMGDGPLTDPVAAEGWLLRAVAMEDPVWSVRAMGSLAKLLGRTEIIPDDDLDQILRELPNAHGQERQTLLELLKLTDPRQKK